MLSNVLNIIGFILVLYSIYIIRKDLLIKKDNKIEFVQVEETRDETYKPIEETTNDFDDIVDKKIKEKAIKEDYKEIIFEKNKMNKDLDLIIKEEDSFENKDVNPLHKKIIELNSIGLTNEDIAKKLGRGIREIDIVLKIYKR